MPEHARAIIWAQWRTLLRVYARFGGNVALSAVVTLIWYGLCALAAVAIAFALGGAKNVEPAPAYMTGGLFAVFLYWQFVPLLLATTGASLDLKRLLVYPVPRGQLFAIEVLLRISISAEMLILMAGATVGLVLNPGIRWWAPLAFLPFTLFNLFLSAGMRDLLTRLLARKRVRELTVFLLVMLAVLPQYLALRSNREWVRQLAALPNSVALPWTAAGELTGGKFSFAAVLSLLAWTTAGYFFGRWQFNKGLRFDMEAARAEDRTITKAGSVADRFFRLPSRLLPDPVGAMVEKDLRFLSRAPRFRLVFLMGFTFGLVVWLPLALGRHNQTGFLAENLLTIVSAYSLMLLGEVLIWNFFGFDRSAAQVYSLAPVRFASVLIAKNLTAATLITLEITLVTAACMLIRVPISGAKVAEAYAVTLVLMLILISLGNLSSIRYPKAIDPGQSWRSSARGFQILLILIYPLAGLPLALPYLARYAFESEVAFFAALACVLAAAAAFYWVALDSAVEQARELKERMNAALSQGDGPIALNL